MDITLIPQDTFWLINKELAKKIGRDEAFLLSILRDYAYNEKFDHHGKSYFSIYYDRIKNDLNISKYRINKMLKTLENYNLINSKYIVNTSVKHFNINQKDYARDDKYYTKQMALWMTSFCEQHRKDIKL